MNSERLDKSSRSPLFSIVTVCFNSEKTVGRTIQSVCNQTFKDFEYIIIDGLSTDGTTSIVEKYSDCVSKIVSEKDSGIYDAMNKGVRMASGKIVGIINSDDWYEPNTLELVAKAYDESDKRTIFHGLCKYHFPDSEGDIHAYHHSVLPSMNIAHPTVFVPTILYQEFGAFDDRFKIAADYELLLRMYRRGISYKRIERILANFQHGGYSAKNSSAFEVLQIHRMHQSIGRKKYYTGLLKHKLTRLF